MIGARSRQTTSSSWTALFMHFAMEVTETNMMMLVAFVFMSILALLVFGALHYTHAKRTRIFANCQPTLLLVVHFHNSPPGTRQCGNNGRNSMNLTACTHNQRRPQENDERFSRTVGKFTSTKFDRLIKT